MPIPPDPANRSRNGPPSRYGSSASRHATRTRSAVGRVAEPPGVSSRWPFSAPARTLTRPSGNEERAPRRIASRQSSDARQIQLAPPAREQGGAKRPVLRPAQLGIPGDQRDRVLSRFLEEGPVAD